MAESAKACLLVVGTRSFAGVRGRLAGSVAAQVAAHSATPVVALRSDEPRCTDPAEFTGLPVAVGVDGSDESMRAFWFAADQADRLLCHHQCGWDPESPTEPKVMRASGLSGRSIDARRLMPRPMAAPAVDVSAGP